MADNVKATIERKLRDAFAPSALEIVDESELHKGHAGYRAGGETHFRVTMESDRAAIAQAVLADPRIQGVHQLRTRMAGSVMMIQMHVDLDPDLRLEAAHAIVVEAERRVLSHYPTADILIHADPRRRAVAPAASEPAPAAEAQAPAADTPPAPPKGPWS